ncbi:hypothetical protein K493DRAFT_1624 [Basidiobolus meristosporus CBS 931.73]|uniref:Uncharacterized protein n=1 Tax=Basidiobolus meristosporus CBS 931.73 TaxID=1314790 RepID=A0A1Y1YN13_9FUNG|nr:hypothetical protein K493DRAFT_1624 [Basidiobolus meristosporus CBS 931.73]|eukprot:ORX99156.1 hypothetical protein K493DRAFT_1624 [Basidiobolus meristosporus CBS 931.73]
MEYKKIAVKKFPRLPNRKTPEARYWRKFKVTWRFPWCWRADVWDRFGILPRPTCFALVNCFPFCLVAHPYQRVRFGHLHQLFACSSL